MLRVSQQDWFVTNKKASKKFEKFLKNQPKEVVRDVDKHTVDQYHHHHLQHHPHHHHQQHHQHHSHHHHQQQQHQLQHQPLQHPLQPLHHLQHQTQYLHPERQNLPPQVDPQPQQPILQYTSLEPPPGPVWVDMDHRGGVLGPEQAPIEMEMADKPEEDSGGMVKDTRRGKEERGVDVGERGKADRKQKDCFTFGGSSGGGGCGRSSSSSSSSSSNTGSSSSESEVEQQERQRQIDQWSLKRPGIMGLSLRLESDRETLKKT